MTARSAELSDFVRFAEGAIVMGFFVAGLFFLRYRRDTRDRLFLIFAVAFWMLAVQRTLLSVTAFASEDTAPFYLLRLAAFLLIIWGVVEKNRVRGRAADSARPTGRRQVGAAPQGDAR
jgi:hypothetical protein